jgi:ubiquinone/menaquinone biosynthesis C-methylase UbiE
MKVKTANQNDKVVKEFGLEWTRFDQSELADEDLASMFDAYFQIFPWDALAHDAAGVDIGCGSGRWAKLVAPKVGHLHLADPSHAALKVAERNLSGITNVSFHNFSVDRLPFSESSLDFAYALGVLHHVPDTAQAIQSVAKLLKPGAPFLIYLYYKFDQRPLWFRVIWRISDLIRRGISLLPGALKNFAADVIALLVYWPLAKTAWLLEKIQILPKSWPLSYYRDRSFYVMRTDALDRFGTRLEQRFTRDEIRQMLETAGFERISFSDRAPYWCAVAYREMSA